ncbi:hypothetical protein F2Q68_00034617 [Brassica cretica]|nr:hypothetical protein F2Q68_00034617 [Brassica cretica]KAF3592170.1 hypothetical protein DY000_02022489 [Brassica cretica]
MAHTTEEKTSPDTPVGGRQVQCAEASRAEMKDEHDVEIKGKAGPCREVSAAAAYPDFTE